MNEIAYKINIASTLEEGVLVLDLFEVVREGHHYLSQAGAIEKRLASQWRALASLSTDKEIFAFLLEKELVFQQGKTAQTPYLESFRFNQFHVIPSHLVAAFNLLSRTQKLYCGNKQIVIDIFGKTEFYYEGSFLKPGQLEITGHLRWRDVDIPLSECIALGAGKPHHWFVRGLTLKFIHTSVNWKQLTALRGAPLLLEGVAIQQFLDTLDSEDEDAPQLVIKKGSLEDALQVPTPFPILKLKDRWGACADLWMDYGQGHQIAFHDPVSVIIGEQKSKIKRQSQAEGSWEKDLLETDFIKKVVGSSHYYCPLDCVAKSLTFLIELGWQIKDWQNRRVIKQTDLHLQFDDNPQGTIAIRGKLQYENHEADVKQVVGAFNRRENFIQLSVDSVGILSLEGPQKALKDLAIEGEWSSGELHIKKNHLGSLEPLWDVAEKTPSLESLKEKLASFKGLQEAFPSPSFQGTLRSYQQIGVNWLAFLHDYGFHGILADEMGLGKTVQVLAFISRLPKGHPHLIVMPTSLLFNWRNEIHRFLPSLCCKVHHGAQRAQTAEELRQFDIILTSYTTLRLDLSLLQDISYSCVILDEAQMIKNANTQIAQAVCRLSSDLRLSLTGTPLENRLQELWSHFHFLMPDLFGTQEEFEANVQAAQLDFRHLERIKRKISPFILRRSKKEVAPDLPSRIDQVMWIEMPEEQRAIYDNLLAGFKGGLLKKVQTEGMGKHRLEVLEAILRLRQVCCHPLLVSSLIENASPPSAKFDALVQDLETLIQEGHKVLVYSQFTSMLHLMTRTAQERNWSYSYLDGSTKNREEAVKQFQEDPTQYLFFISLKAGGVGLNLTAADYVYLYDPWWNEAVEEQAIQRAHRIGRQEVVIAKRLIIAESIEEKMMRLKAAKRLMIEDVLEKETLSPQFTVEDLEFLLQ